MATRQFVDSYIQPFTHKAPLEFDRKEPIVTPGDHVDWNLWPCFKPAWLTKDDVGFWALMRLALLNNLGRNVMQEVRGEIKMGAVAAAVRSRCSRLDCPRIVPPLACRLAGNRDHRIDQHQHAHSNLLTYQW